MEQRDLLNSNLEDYDKVTNMESNWIKLSPEQSIFHDNGIGKQELKFIHPEGREVVFDGDTLEIITNPEFKGTYNYANPKPLPNSINDIPEFLKSNTEHTIYDVIPYLILGNER